MDLRRASLAVLVLAVCASSAAAKTFELYWDTPSNGLILPSVSTARCGDVIRFKCPKHATQGIYKLSSANYDGACPSSFASPDAGKELAKPEQACDFELTVGDEPDFFITSHAPGACEQNLKVAVHATCMQDGGVSAASVLGARGLEGGLTSRFAARQAAAGGSGEAAAGAPPKLLSQAEREAQMSGLRNALDAAGVLESGEQQPAAAAAQKSGAAAGTAVGALLAFAGAAAAALVL